MQPRLTRLEHCPACAKPSAGEWERCIFCGHSLLSGGIEQWRTVYHPYSYADAMLASAALRANGVTVRVETGNLLMRHGGVVQVAADEHPIAREVLRRVRGVRTDTEYLEWQQLKRRRGARSRLLIGAIAAGTAIAAGVALYLFHAADADRPAITRTAR